MAQVLIIGLVTPFIHGFFQGFVAQLNYLTAFGAILILGNLYINQSVTHWRNDTRKSAAIFVIGLILIYLGL